MTRSSVLIVEPNIEWANELASELLRFNLDSIIRSQVELDKELEDAGNQFGICVINAILPNMEGYTLYSYLLSLRSWNLTNFVIIADDEYLANSLSLLKPDRAVIAWKGEGTSSIVQKIVNQLPFENYFDTEYYPEVTGRISPGQIQEIIEYLKLTYASGKLIITNENDYCIIDFQDGEIADSLHSFLSGESAINNVLTWSNGQYRFERKRVTFDDIHRLVSEKRKKSTERQENQVQLNDVFTDLFSILYHFLTHQINNQQINEIFQVKLQDYRERYPTLKNCIFAPFGEAVLIFKEDVYREEIPAFLELFDSILNTIFQKYPELDFENLKMSLEEIRPFLSQYNIYKKVFEKIEKAGTRNSYLNQLKTTRKLALN
ncbi:MAG: hypothetical protein Kow0037_04110 [Calditrichia bacterium]